MIQEGTAVAATESEHLKSLIISTAQELWEDKDALRAFLNVVRRSEGFAKMADTRNSPRSGPRTPPSTA
jgi:hypothetical protein